MRAIITGQVGVDKGPYLEAVKAQALGGRHYKTSPEGVAYVDQNFDV